MEQKILRAYNLRPTIKEMRTIFGQDRERAVGLLREARDHKGSLDGFNEDVALIFLLQLEDHKTIQFVVNKMMTEYDTWSSQGADICWRSGQIQIVPYLAPLLFINEPTTYSPDQSMEGPEKRRSLFAMTTIASIVMASDEVPTSVRDWARSCAPSTEYNSSAREKMRAWWKANEAAIRAHDYAKLVPGSPFAQSDFVWPPFNEVPPSSSREKKIAATTGVTGNVVEPASKPAPSSEPGRRVSASNWFLIAAGTLLTLLVAVFGCQRAMRTKSKPRS